MQHTLGASGNFFFSFEFSGDLKTDHLKWDNIQIQQMVRVPDFRSIEIWTVCKPTFLTIQIWTCSNFRSPLYQTYLSRRPKNQTNLLIRSLINDQSIDSGDLKSIHLKSGLFEGGISNGSVFKWLGFSYGYSVDPNHSKTGPFNSWMFLSGFQMFFDTMESICPDFK